jgi:hypothetical protein
MTPFWGAGEGVAILPSEAPNIEGLLQEGPTRV